jgi:type IV pilus assembly protein PilQ
MNSWFVKSNERELETGSLQGAGIAGCRGPASRRPFAMGKLNEESVWGRLPVVALAIAMLLLQWGCSSANKSSEPAPAAASGTATAAAVTPARAPAQIGGIELKDEGGSASIAVSADRALVWTSFRNADGDLVVELPNSEPGAGLAPVRATGSLVAAVQVERVADGDRPLTRLVVKTSEPSEHALTGEGDTLRLKLLPIGEAQPVTLAYEQPVAEEEPVEPEPAVAESAPMDADETASPEIVVAEVPPASRPMGIPQDAGTPDMPQVSTATGGVTASQLLSVRVLEAGAATRIQVVGDGEFSFATFKLQNPERFVIDLRGVVNSSPASTLPVGGGSVDQVRVGQFKPRPEPVARVVFDLNDATVPSISRTSDGLIVAWGESSAANQTAANQTGSSHSASDQPIAVAPAPRPVQRVEAARPQPTLAEQMASAEAPPEAEPVDEGRPVEVPSVPVYLPAPGQETGGEALASAGSNSQPASAPRGADVALYEAQQVQPVDEAQVQRERLLESFGSLVINRQERQYVGEPISMSLKNADLVETLRSFAKISDLNFIIQPGVGGVVTVELKAVPWDQAMEQILKINNLGMDIDGTIVRIAPAEKLRKEAEDARRLAESKAKVVPLRTVMRSLSYARAAEIAPMLEGRGGGSAKENRILSLRGAVQIDARTNSLIIRELPESIETVLAVIDNLDTAPPQVTIESRIVEATKNFSRSLGIQWDYDYLANQANGNTTGLQFPNTVDSDGGVGLLTGGANGFLNMTLGNILDTFRLNARLQVAEAEGLLTIVSAPRVTTLNNQAASIQSGVQIPIQTVSDRTVSVQYVNATLSMNVTPQVTAEGTIVLDINVAKRQPLTSLIIVGSAGAPISTKDARTRVIVRDGGTAVIGGIYEVQSSTNQDRVPGLANIPVLGHLFKNRNRSETNNELMIFITPRIVQI